jgi:hypothetical protein
MVTVKPLLWRIEMGELIILAEKNPGMQRAHPGDFLL